MHATRILPQRQYHSVAAITPIKILASYMSCSIRLALSATPASDFKSLLTIALRSPSMLSTQQKHHHFDPGHIHGDIRWL